MPWGINRTIRDVMYDQQCPLNLRRKFTESDRAALERERQRNANNGQLGIFDNMQDCFKGNGHMPGFLQNAGAGQFVVDIGLGFDAKETRTAVDHGFVAFSFEMLPGNIREVRKVVGDDPRFQFVTLQKQGEQWVVPDLPQPTAGTGFAYIINAAVSDEEMTVKFAESTGRTYIESIYSGRKDGISVPVLPLHKLLPNWLPHIDYLKIDTQGFELKVLRGCLGVLRERRCRYVTFEFSPWLMKRTKAGDPLELIRLLPSMGALCYTASAAREHLRPGAPWQVEDWLKTLDGGNFTGYGRPVLPRDPYGPWVDIFCYWPFSDTSGAEANSVVTWEINRTIRDVMDDQQCPIIVARKFSESDRAALERERQRNATSGQLGIFDDMQDCFKATSHIPGFLQNAGAGQFVVDIGLRFDAPETTAAVNNGFVVFSFTLRPTNIEALPKAVAGDPRFQFVTLQKQGEQWVVPDLPQPTAGAGFAYIINAGVSDEEMTAKFSDATAKSYIQSIYSGRKDGVSVPVLPLHKLLPNWLPHIDYLKIDTQGFELKVLRGCLGVLRERRCRYVTFEFSPWLMKRAMAGDPLELIQLLPSMGALCYTASAARGHLRPGAPWPVEDWLKTLDGGNFTGYGRPVHLNDQYGPFVNIFCYWPYSHFGDIPKPASVTSADLVGITVQPSVRSADLVNMTVRPGLVMPLSWQWQIPEQMIAIGFVAVLLIGLLRWLRKH
ncbi:unnamed protein product [Symbiodinium natans]|uniref:Methyltransferase FkbM domain-containing protein n=1 Tax=Symbiodinium natans TaxID=878477 RepID=A0A812RFL6_9DINO|nr:unnamed protein product [Symbiodinium natans]